MHYRPRVSPGVSFACVRTADRMAIDLSSLHHAADDGLCEHKST